MAGTIVANTINTDTAGGVYTTLNALDATAKAWVTFITSSSTCVIRASFNVSSITYNAAGDFSVNLTNALTDANYTLACQNFQTSGNTVCNIALNTSRTSTASVVQVTVIQGSARFDPTTNVSIAVFR
jgi:hypothetical protein